MAEAVVYAIAEVVGSIFLADVIVTAAYVIAATAYTNSEKRSQQRRARDQYNASLKDRELTIRTGVANRVRIYGRDRVGGQLVYAQSTGPKQEFLHLVIKLADHECEAIDEVWFGDVKLPEPDANGYITSGDFVRKKLQDTRQELTTNGSGQVTLTRPATTVTAVVVAVGGGGSGLFDDDDDTGTTPFSHVPDTALITGLPANTAVVVGYEYAVNTPLVRIRKHLGQPLQAADADLVAESGGKWTNAHIGTGMCYVAVRIEFDTDVFGQIGLPEMKFVVRGAKVYDPRFGGTSYTANTALCVADYLKHADGMAALASTVPTSELIAAANICDETVQLTPGGATQARYETSTTISTAQAPRDALEDLLQDMAGRCVWTQGRWLIRPGAYRTPGPALGVDDLAGFAELAPALSREQRFNAVRVTYRDPQKAWAEVQAPLVTNALYESEDGNVRVIRDYQMTSAMDALRAQRLAKIELERSRQALRFRAPFNLRAYDLAPTDTVPLTLAKYGFAGKVFEVLERTQHHQGRLEYLLQETAAGVYAWNFGEATTVDLAPDTTLPNPYTPPAVLAGLAVASGTAHLQRMRDGTVIARGYVSWAQSTEAFVLNGGAIELQWKDGTSADWQQAPTLPGDATNAYIGPLQSGRAIFVRARATRALGRVGAWSTVAHNVVGKTAPPADVSGFVAKVVPTGVRFEWTDLAPLEADYARTELRVGATWAGGTLLNAAAASGYTWLTPAQGSYTILAKHYDTSGNESVSAIGVSVAVDAGSGSFIGEGGVELLGNNATKISGGNAWNAAVRSKHGFVGAAVASGVAIAGNHDAGLGLNTDPTTDLSFGGIDYWVFWKANGFIDIYESGSLRGTFGTYAAGDRFSVHYDGVNVRYYKNGTVLRTVAATIAGALFFDSSIFQQGHGINDARFEAQSAVRDIGTEQLQPEAATEVQTDQFDFGDNTFGYGAVGTLRTFSVTPTSNCQIEFTAAIETTFVTGGYGLWWSWSAGAGLETLMFNILNSGFSPPLNVSIPSACTFSIAATAGVTYNFRIKRSVGGSGTRLRLSVMRATMIKR
jgi:Putative phage tail protein